MEQINLSDSLKEKLAKAESLDDVLKACQEEGFEVTKEQLEEAEKYQQSELNEDDLDAVAGGCPILVLAAAVAVVVFWMYARSRRR